MAWGVKDRSSLHSRLRLMPSSRFSADSCRAKQWWLPATIRQLLLLSPSTGVKIQPAE